MRDPVDVEEAGPGGQGQTVTFEADPGEAPPSARPCAVWRLSGQIHLQIMKVFCCHHGGPEHWGWAGVEGGQEGASWREGGGASQQVEAGAPLPRRDIGPLCATPAWPARACPSWGWRCCEGLGCLGFLGGAVAENPFADAGDVGSTLELGRSLGGGNGNVLQYSCLENPVDRGAWWATARGVVKESDD